MRLPGGVAVFHDASDCEAVVASEAGAAAPVTQRLAVDLVRFDGSYLSFAIDLPDDAVRELTQEHVLEVTSDLRRSGIGRVWVRLNLLQGPDAAQSVTEVPVVPGRPAMFEIALRDGLAASKGWIDVILERPGPGRVVLRDFVVARRPRASF